MIPIKNEKIKKDGPKVGGKCMGRKILEMKSCKKDWKVECQRVGYNNFDWVEHKLVRLDGGWHCPYTVSKGNWLMLIE